MCVGQTFLLHDTVEKRLNMELGVRKMKVGKFIA